MSVPPESTSSGQPAAATRGRREPANISADKAQRPATDENTQTPKPAAAAATPSTVQTPNRTVVSSPPPPATDSSRVSLGQRGTSPRPDTPTVTQNVPRSTPSPAVMSTSAATAGAPSDNRKVRTKDCLLRSHGGQFR